MTVTLVDKDAITDGTAQAVELLAARLFQLRIVGDPGAVDHSAASIPLIYRQYINGKLQVEGFPRSTGPMTEPEVLASCCELFEAEIAAGRSVIVWRVLPQFRQHTDFDRDSPEVFIRFRCAFMAPCDLKLAKDLVVKRLAALDPGA